MDVQDGDAAGCSRSAWAGAADSSFLIAFIASDEHPAMPGDSWAYRDHVALFDSHAWLNRVTIFAAEHRVASWNNALVHTRGVSFLTMWLLDLVVLVMGLVIVSRRKIRVTRKWTIEGVPARVIGWSFTVGSLLSWLMSVLSINTLMEQTNPDPALAVIPLLPYGAAVAITLVLVAQDGWRRKEHTAS